MSEGMTRPQLPLSHLRLQQHQKDHQPPNNGLVPASFTHSGGHMMTREEEAATSNGYTVIEASNAESSESKGIFFSSLCADEEEEEEDQRQHQVQKEPEDGRRNILNASRNKSLALNFRNVAETYEHNTSSHPKASPAPLSRKSSQTQPSLNSAQYSQAYFHHQYTPRSDSCLSVSDNPSDDGGYEGSASSNDANGGSCATSCSSPSLYDDQRYGSLYNGQDNGKDNTGDKPGVNGGTLCNTHTHAPLSHSKHTVKRVKQSTSYSSDLADFSSSSASLQHYQGVSVADGSNGITYGTVAGTKTTGLSSDESDSDGEEYTLQMQHQKRKHQLKRRQHHQQGQEPQSMETSVSISQIRRWRKRKNIEDRNYYTWSVAHAQNSTRSQQPTERDRAVLSESSSPTTIFSCNSNSTFSSPPTNMVQEKQHNELKATFQSALKQLDHTLARSPVDTKSSFSSCGPASPLFSPVSSEQQITVSVARMKSSISAQLHQGNDSSHSFDSMNKIHTRSSYTTSNTHQQKIGLSISTHTHSLIYDLGADVMACIMSYLEPDAVHTILVMPLSKLWRSVFTLPQDLWKVLCLSAPFHAKFDGVSGGNDHGIDENWLDSHHLRNPLCSNLEVRRLLGRYRMLYSSFIKCLRYLHRIKDDVSNHRTPLGIEDSRLKNDGVNEDATGPSHPFDGNSNLKHFFAKAREVRHRNDNQLDSKDEGSEKKKQANGRSYVGVEVVSRHDEAEKAKNIGKPPGVKYGHSKLTQRLLGPVHASGVAGNVNLPWSCAIYSVVNWMVAFTDVAGIQNMCLKVLPELLEDEKQRTSAQHAGLTDIVLRAMVLFPDITELHTAAFHTLVLLARPLGGKEGMLFHRAMVKSSGIFNVGSNTGKSGIAVMLDSMKRFSADEDLQAMGCWSMVNIALIPSQKVVLVKLGGISIAANAIMQHPHSAEVHFRALFALINLVIPSENLPEKSPEAAAIREQVGGVNETSEREMLDESVGQITNLVVVSMKNFWSSEAILNRACLVLHNLSLNENYHRVLLWTPNCYQMLEWCIGNYRHDAVLQQSAGGTLQRLQMTLANDADLRQRFTESIRAQQQYIS